MTGRPWYAFYPDKYYRDTSHLTMVQDAAYRRLLDAYYQRERGLPVEPVALFQIARATSHGERAAVNSVITEFFYLGEDGLYHNRKADEELARAGAISARRAEAGKKGAAKTNASLNKSTTNGATNIPATEQQTVGNEAAIADTLTSTSTKKKEENKKEVDRSPKTARRKPRHALPDNFPDEAAKSDAVQHWGTRGRFDLPPEIDTQAAQFRDHHLKTGETMADWAAAWRTWYRNSLKFNKPNGFRKEGEHEKLARVSADLIRESRERGGDYRADQRPEPELPPPDDDRGPITGVAAAVLPRFGGSH